MKRHTPSPATAGRLSTRSLRVAAALVLPLGLLSACSVSLSSPQSQDSPGEAAQATPSVSVSVGTDGVSVNDGSTSVSVGSGGVSVTDGSTGGSGNGSSGGSGGSAPANPGTATDCSWLDQYVSPHEAVNVGSDTYMITQANETIRIANDLRTLTVSGGNADVVVTNADNVIINGANAYVYVCNVGSVTINSGVGNATVIWGPGVTPVVQDFGSNTETHAYRP